MAELGLPDVNQALWHGLYAPRGTDPTVVEKLNSALSKALDDPSVVAQLEQLGTFPFPEKDRTLEAHARLFAQELTRVKQLMSSLGFKPVDAKVKLRFGGGLSRGAILQNS